MDSIDKLAELQKQGSAFERSIEHKVINGIKVYKPVDALAVKAFRQSPMGAEIKEQEAITNGVKYDSEGNVVAVGLNQVHQYDPEVMYTFPYRETETTQEVNGKEKKTKELMVVMADGVARAFSIGTIAETQMVSVNSFRVEAFGRYKFVSSRKVQARKLLDDLQFTDIAMGEKLVEALNKPQED